MKNPTKQRTDSEMTNCINYPIIIKKIPQINNFSLMMIVIIIHFTERRRSERKQGQFVGLGSVPLDEFLENGVIYVGCRSVKPSVDTFTSVLPSENHST